MHFNLSLLVLSLELLDDFVQLGLLGHQALNPDLESLGFFVLFLLLLLEFENNIRVLLLPVRLQLPLA